MYSLCFCNDYVGVLYSNLLVVGYCVLLLEVGLLGIVRVVVSICCTWCCFVVSIDKGMCCICLLFYTYPLLYLICG